MNINDLVNTSQENEQDCITFPMIPPISTNEKPNVQNQLFNETPKTDLNEIENRNMKSENLISLAVSKKRKIEDEENSNEDSSKIKVRKRQKYTPEQVAILEEIYAHNSMPNHEMREKLGHLLGRSARSIQIWFQNRRAKVRIKQKELIKKSPPTPQDSKKILASLQTPQLKTAFNLSKIKIGNWECIAQNVQMTISAIFDKERCQISWEISDSKDVKRIEMDFFDISGIQLNQWKDDLSNQASVSIELLRPPRFTMRSKQVQESYSITFWKDTEDFTTRQASLYRHHTLYFCGIHQLSGFVNVLKSMHPRFSTLFSTDLFSKEKLYFDYVHYFNNSI